MVVPIVAVVSLWQIGWMPPSDVVLLPLCIGLALIGVIVAGVAWRKGSRGRVVQGIGLALAPIALYFTGLLRLVWDGVVALVSWATSIIFSPTMWFGISLLGLCVVLWVVGGLLTRRAGPAPKAAAPAGTREAGGRHRPDGSSKDRGQEGDAQGQGPRSRKSTRRWPRSKRSSRTAASTSRIPTRPGSTKAAESLRSRVDHQDLIAEHRQTPDRRRGRR